MTSTQTLARVGALAAVALAASASASAADGRYIVKFRDLQGAATTVQAAGGRVALELRPQRALAAELPAAAVEVLRRHPRVEYVEVDARRYPLAQSVPYGIPMVQANDAVFTGNAASGSNTTVCIIDSGYQRAHEDLPDTNVTGTNDAGSGNWAEDSCGHGSHVAGTIAASNNGLGVLGVVGNGNLHLHIEKVFSGADCGWAYSSSLVTALNRCVAAAGNNRLVINMSLGGSTSSRTERTAFDNAYANGVLPIAAAGNDGNTRTSYPAGYAGVVSVAAVDAAGVVASFSQQNSDVELAAPGVGVVSTTPFKPSTLSAGGSSWVGTDIDGSARTSVSGNLVNGGDCSAVGAWAGRVVLCQRGTISFAQKVANVVSGGGVGAAIYNNEPGGFAGTLNGSSTIPAISLSDTDGDEALGRIGNAATLDNTAGVGNGYEAYDGTSMATPHVAGVAALVWSLNPTRSAADIREALQVTAIDKGAAGRDNAYGFGIIQAKAAHAWLQAPVAETAPTLTAVSSVRKKGKAYARLNWSGGSCTQVDVRRNGVVVQTTANDGSTDDGPLNSGSYGYQVCVPDTGICSATAVLNF
ncbi:MAG: S8 family serine peptidase [Burkholderiaceae bacterium]|nr:S8 family serine peptidase [Burkholderiaceae bacterium]